MEFRVYRSTDTAYYICSDRSTYLFENKRCEGFVYLLTDGMSDSPDLVYGRAAPELVKKINLMRTEIIGCE